MRFGKEEQLWENKKSPARLSLIMRQRAVRKTDDVSSLLFELVV